MFHQILDPLGSIAGDTLVALVPVAVLLFLLAVLRMSAWLAVIIGSAVTIALGILIWKAPVGDTFASYGLGAATGIWSVDWIVFWGVIIYNTLVATGAFSDFKGWLVRQATADIRVQTLLMAWSFGALMEGLVGFGYPWAVVAPILIALGVADLAAIRVAALANNAPVSFGALGAPIIGLAAVTGLPLMALSQSIGRIVAILALAPPWLLIYLVSGKRGIRTGWPLAIVGSLGYIAGQFPVAEWVGPYLPDITGAIVSFAAIFLLLKVWRPKEILGFGGRPLTEAEIRDHETGTSAAADDPHALAGPAGPARVVRSLIPFGILVVVVIAWTGPWSPLTKWVPFKPEVSFVGSLSGQVGSEAWKFAPAVAGTAILVSWLLIMAYLRPTMSHLGWVFRESFHQMWGALLVGPFIFGLAYVFNSSGMANSMANGFAKVGTVFIILAPVLGWIAVALSGSNTSSNAVFGHFQYTVGKLLGAPVLLFPSLNSIGAEVGKPVAPQTASVGVATTKFVRSEGQVIRYNMAWTLVMLAYLILIGCLYYFVFPAAMKL
ncbi:L-lactate permease [Leekyejoonella antrihumi]|uniref:L-lactate permease n=1 Tax=Leekyejoonella antrihumi TaxID=1660198 RepID=A0A563E5W2_9MICO|nr:L-lactate permease [Leekyejoonella antrihumi]TWP37633.1 L-lactate permease [Leekyejoonella antrihumi]